MTSFEFLKDVVGINDDNTHCHPYKQTVKGQKGKFSYTFESHNQGFKPATAQELIALIEGGQFDEKGRIRMLPPGSTNTKKNGALRVVLYKGQALPLLPKNVPHSRDLNVEQPLTPSAGRALEKEGRLPAEQLRRVTSEHIWQAVQALLGGGQSEAFGPSTDYDLLVGQGARLAPKQVFGLAASVALGFSVKPLHFTAGVGTVCFELLEEAGYRIVPKGAQVDLAEIPCESEEREWAEGRVKLVAHLRRERSTGLSKAKKAVFLRKHGKLFCENCGIDPIEVYGDLGGACIEVHHDAVHVSDMDEDHKTTLEHLRCLCANCHRIEHRRLKV